MIIAILLILHELAYLMGMVTYIKLGVRIVLGGVGTIWRAKRG